MAPYMDLLRHANVRLIAKFARNTFSFLEPTHWEAETHGTQANGTAKWQVMIIGVANLKGLLKYRKAGADAGIVQAAVQNGAQV